MDAGILWLTLFDEFPVQSGTYLNNQITKVAGGNLLQIALNFNTPPTKHVLPDMIVMIKLVLLIYLE